MDYEKKYKEALERAREQLEGAKVFDYKEEQTAHDIRTTTYAIFPELKESEDERIRKTLVRFFTENYPEETEMYGSVLVKEAIAWLEKQGEKEPLPIDIDAMVSKYANNDKRENEGFGKPVNCMIRAYRQGIEDTLNIVKQEPVEMDKLVKGAYKTLALSFINYLDAHSYEGKMCVSNAECEDIEDAFANADWGKIGRYYNKFTQKTTDPCDEAKHTEYSTMLQSIWDKVCNLEGKLNDIYGMISKPYQHIPYSINDRRCWFEDGTCMNPHRDCVNCPRPNVGRYTTITSNNLNQTTTSINPDDVKSDGIL